MISLVIVSHSAKLAEGIVELARGMSGPDVRIAAAGGLEPPDSSLGTDPVRVLNAIEDVYSDDGVLVLMDLGSAVLSAEMAVDLLEPQRREHILLCEAPLVEGAVIGAVQARLGSSLGQTAVEVRAALAGKQQQLGVQPVNVTAPVVVAPPDQPVQSLRLMLHNRVGLHARPAAQLVQAISGLQAAVYARNVSAGGKLVSARSINGLLTLGVQQNHEIEFVASGPQAEEAIDAIRQLAENNFGDAPDRGDQTAPAKQTFIRAGIAPVHGILTGLPASAGMTTGPARLFRRELPEISTDAGGDPESEWEALTAALEKTRAQVRAQQARDRTGIFEAHLLFLDDEALVEPARRAVFETKLSAAAAWQQALDRVIADYQTLDDDYLRARAADVQAVGQQTLVNLLGQAVTHPAMDAPGILVAEDLTPGDIAPLDPANVRGICTASGSPTSHAAILARTLGISMVTGLGDAILSIGEGTPLALNGDTGEVFLQPDNATVEAFTRQAEALRAGQIQALAESAGPAVTRDGRRIEVGANVGSIADIHDAVWSGAEGVGVLRTEFLFLDRQTAPGEDEQYAAYHVAAEALGGRPLIIRTLDVGGDKPLPYLDQGYEANPFLGLARGALMPGLP